jgi:hypothetical protein
MDNTATQTFAPPVTFQIGDILKATFVTQAVQIAAIRAAGHNRNTHD